MSTDPTCAYSSSTTTPTSDLPIVLLPARDLPDDVRHGYALGASLVISKPCDSEQLVSLLEVLRSSRSGRAQ